jgi:hypothetical protein
MSDVQLDGAHRSAIRWLVAYHGMVINDDRPRRFGGRWQHPDLPLTAASLRWIVAHRDQELGKLGVFRPRALGGVGYAGLPGTVGPERRNAERKPRRH